MTKKTLHLIKNIKKIKTCNQAGFTFIEVIVALLLLVIAFTTMTASLYRSTNNTTSGNTLTMANLLAQEKLEELKSMPDLDALDLLNGTVENNIVGQDVESGTSGSAAGLFSRSVTVSAGPNDITRMITVSVTWARGVRGVNNRTLTVSSLTFGSGI